MWFRKDLRLEDNTAFQLAVTELSKNDQLLCVFQLNPTQFKVGSMNHDHFFTALANFEKVAKANGFPIHMMFGEPLASFQRLKDLYPAWDKVYFNRDERGKGANRDQLMVNYFNQEGLAVTNPLDSHLHGAKTVQKEDGTPYKMFTPYYKQWNKLPKRPSVKLDLRSFHSNVVDDSVNFSEGRLKLVELLDNVQHDFSHLVGEEQAEKQLNDFVLNHMADYQEMRDIPSVPGTSKLSPYLRTGEISIRKVWQAAFNMEESDGKQTYLKELCWRDFYNMIYVENPRQEKIELKEKYRDFPWKQESSAFDAWKEGTTGYPIIDAAMRQLNQTGWMHNRLRMLVASFLTKDLLTDWRLGEAYFSEKLIDYDSASNIGGWQWASSTGTDAVPYFRIFNPTTQSQKFDKEGIFIRKYLPELANVPDKFLHEPQKMTRGEQHRYNCLIGTDYPEQIVNHKEARAQALELFKAWD